MHRIEEDGWCEVREINIAALQYSVICQIVLGKHFIRATACTKTLAFVYRLKPLWTFDKFSAVYWAFNPP
jgi:hypothetical protein